MLTTEEIIEEIRSECSCPEHRGSRGVFYENFGSGFSRSLHNLALTLDAVKQTNPELAHSLAKSLYYG